MRIWAGDFDHLCDHSDSDAENTTSLTCVRNSSSYSKQVFCKAWRKTYWYFDIPSFPLADGSKYKMRFVFFLLLIRLTNWLHWWQSNLDSISFAKWKGFAELSINASSGQEVCIQVQEFTFCYSVRLFERFLENFHVDSGQGVIFFLLTFLIQTREMNFFFFRFD